MAFIFSLSLNSYFPIEIIQHSMVNVLLFDTYHNRLKLSPFTDTRTIASLRVGITTIIEKWQALCEDHEFIFSFITESYLAKKFTTFVTDINVCVNGSFLPTQNTIEAIARLTPGESLWYRDTLLAFCTQNPTELTIDFCSHYEAQSGFILYELEELITIQHKWDLFLHHAAAMEADLQVIRRNRNSASISDKHTICYNPDDIFIEEGAEIKAAILNAEKGPIYIGKNAVVEEQAVLKGPLVIAEGAQVKVGSYVYDHTTIGPYSKVGGEVAHSIIFEYSNKAHGGFMGHSVIGEWCNIGASATISNLRNDYQLITVWDEFTQSFINSRQQFSGLFLGAYSKCGISTNFNTGTVIGIGASLFGAGYMKRYLPAFSKGSPPHNFVVNDLDDVLLSIVNMMKRRNQELTPVDKGIISHLYDYYAAQR